MPQITNTGTRTPLGLASGVVIPPGQTVAVPTATWARAKKSRIVGSWLASGTLRVVDDEPAPADEPDDRTDEERAKDALIAALAEFGIDRTRRSSIESLEKQLAEAKAAAEDDE